MDSEAQIQSSPLTQRVQFLEAKGLTGPEIEEAMKQATRNQSYAAVPPQPYAGAPYGAYGPSPYPIQPPNQPWDWRDYFVSLSTLLKHFRSLSDLVLRSLE